MKKLLFLSVILLGVYSSANSQVAINNNGNTPDASAMLEITSDSKGILIPRMTDAERLLINSPATGLLVYQTNNAAGFYYYDGNYWLQFADLSSIARELNDLDDAKSDSDGSDNGSSLFLGINAGAADDESDNRNVGVGFDALKTNTTGSYNTALGCEALKVNTTGDYNVASGKGSLRANTEGGWNTASGTYSLYSNTEGHSNTAIGYQALDANKAGSNATAIGYNAMLYSNNSTTAFNNFNVALGYEALRGSVTASDNTGNNNTALGYQTLWSNTEGDYNVASGKNALYSNTEGDYNVANGNSAMYSNTTGGANFASGYQSLYHNTIGYSNVAVGTGSLFSNKAGSKATAVGQNAMQYANNTTTAFNSENVALGYEALRGSMNVTNNTGNSNTAVGYESLWSITSGSNNTSSGNKSLYNNTEGASNSAVGQGAMFFNTTGNENTSLGVGSYYTNQAGSQGTAIGCRAMQFTYNSTTAFTNKNVALGYEALRGGYLNADANTGNSNTALGFQALWSNTTGDENASNGYQALYSNTNGNRNTATGYFALNKNETGDNNTAMGNLALNKNETGENNTAIGISSLHTNLSGDHNTAIGSLAGHNSTGNRNVFIGSSAGYSETGDDKLYIDNTFTNDPLIYGDFANDKLKVNGALEVSSQIKISSSADTPEEGMIRWNSTEQDFEGYTGTKWVSLTKANSSIWGIESIVDVSENNKLIASDGADGDRLGISVSISGDYAIIGAISADIGSNSNQGSAYIFVRSGSSWTQQAKLTASDGAAGDGFGTTVSISGDYAIIGAWWDDTGSNISQGSAYIFVRSGSSWTQQEKLTASDGAAGDRFGNSVSIYGDYAIIGSEADDIGSNSDQGSAYIFVRSGSSWIQQEKLTASDGAASDEFGTSVSLSGDYAIIGSEADDIGSNSNQGSAYIFIRSGSSWTQQEKLTASDGAVNDYYGNSVSISGDYAIIGSKNDDIGSNSSQGSAYIFVRSGSSWTQQEKLTTPDGADDDNFGGSVSISGYYAIIGASNADISGNISQGSAYIFFRSESTWIQKVKMTASDGAEGDEFGCSVSISGDYSIIGAESDDIGSSNSQGSAYMFDKQ